jgi:CRP-like cAMP-binding protein
MSEATGSAGKVAQFLSRTPLFSKLERAAIDKLAAAMEPVPLTAGAVLMREGEAGDALYVVVSGRLRASVANGGTPDVVGEIGPGEVVGEMALLSDEPRSATVQAVRDSHLLALSKPVFTALIRQRPGVLLELTRLIIGRLQRSIRQASPPSGVRTVAIVPAAAGADLLQFCEQLADALGTLGSTMLLNRERLSSQLRNRDAISTLGERMIIQHLRLEALTATDTEVAHGSELDAETTQWLHNLETSQDSVLYQADPGPSPWTTRCLRQADRILLVADASVLPVLSEIEEQLAGEEREHPDANGRAETELVLLHPPSTSQPHRTARWLEHRAVRRHHHLRSGSRDDFARLARSLADRQVALVLGGGGARGVAHVGVLKALEEHAIPVDLVGGTSFGALMAAGPAMGWSADLLRRGVKRALVDPGRPIDYTAPLLALTKGKKATEQIRRTYGETCIEDLWLPYFCNSSNLTRGTMTVHTRGPLWRAIRASVAIPGILPQCAHPRATSWSTAG